MLPLDRHKHQFSYSNLACKLMFGEPFIGEPLIFTFKLMIL